MKARSYEVPTKVLLAQGQATLRDLQVDGTVARRTALGEVGVDAGALRAELSAANDRLQAAEIEQERAKAAYLQEAAEDRALAEEGYRYKLALDARVRAYTAAHGDGDDLRVRFRFGKLGVARARGVVYELRIVLPEAEAMKSKLAAAGIDDAFIDRGHAILARLERDETETSAARSAREQATTKVRAGELEVSRILARLVAADEAIAVEQVEVGPVFRLDLIRAELARVRALREARAAASVADAVVTE